jgi:hypothetical protein
MLYLFLQSCIMHPRKDGGMLMGEVLHAAMAQRKGELLKLETLERLASLYNELQQEAAAANFC